MNLSMVLNLTPNLIVLFICSFFKPKANNTCDGVGVDDEQAEPVEQAILVNFIIIFSALYFGNVIFKFTI